MQLVTMLWLNSDYLVTTQQLEIVLIFSLSVYCHTGYLPSHPVHKCISHRLIWIRYWRSVKLFQEKLHKIQTNSTIFHHPWNNITTMAVSHQTYWNSFILKRKLYWAYFLNARQHTIQYISNNILTIWNKMADLTDFVNRKCFLHMCTHRTLVTNKVRICSVI